VNDRAFRLDFFIAIAALLISALTAGTLIYQTRVSRDQFAETIWPYLTLGTIYGVNGETIELTNDGLGPALVRSAQLKVDGIAVRGWNDYFATLANDPDLRPIFEHTRAAVAAGKAKTATLSSSSIGPSSTLRPGDSQTLLKIVLADEVPTRALTKHSVTIGLCYCSLNKTCWTLYATSGKMGSDPRPVSACTAGFAIQSNPITKPLMKS
jgi:hypothetical protein